MADLRLHLRRVLDGLGAAPLALPGAGQTPQRHRVLAGWGREDLSLARLLEAHTDATAILAEAGRQPRAAVLYGVWASDGPDGRLEAVRQPDGSWRLQGVKQFCSGASLVDSALITAHAAGVVLLFDVHLGSPGIDIKPSSWATPAFAATATGPVSFDAVPVPSGQVVGDPGWYLARPGFWSGAIGPAACWAGGALALVDAASRLRTPNPHTRAQLGALQAAAWGLTALLDQAGREIDADPQDREAQARGRALKVRHLIERQCTDVLDRFGRATGPRLLAFDEHIARQHQELALYIRQCHAERDLEALVEPLP